MNSQIAELLSEALVLHHDERNHTGAAGESFNLFDILNIGSLETLTHSPFLAELLSPTGRHGMRDTFLRLFIAEFNLKLDPAKAWVKLEHHIGPVTEISGGRIDILLRDSYGLDGNVVLIENKIYAADQPNQLLRYQNAFPKGAIIYLTLDGKKADQKLSSSGVLSLSYREDIMRWLKRCLERSKALPLLHATLTQYIDLLKNLTGLSFMNTEIAALVTQREDKLTAYFELAQSKTTVIRTVVERLRAQVSEIASSLGLELNFPPGDLYSAQSTFYLWDEKMKKRNVQIAFQFQKAEHCGLSFGIAYVKPGPPENAPAGIFERFQAVYPMCRPSPNYWPAVTNWVERYVWKADDYAAICFRDKFKDELRDKVVALAKIARDAIDVETHGS